MNKSPNRPDVCLDPARSQLPRQLAQGKWSRANALAQPVGVNPRQNPLLVAADFAGRDPSGLTPQILPLRHTGRTDLKLFCNGTNGFAGVSPRQRPFTNVFRIRSRHPCWPPVPAWSLNQKFSSQGIPIPVKKQHALADHAPFAGPRSPRSYCRESFHDVIVRQRLRRGKARIQGEGRGAQERPGALLRWKRRERP